MKLECPYAGECGSCFFTREEYEETLLLKTNMVRKLIGSYCEVHPVEGMEHPFHYRNKVHATFKKLKDGQVICGPFREGTHRIVNAEHCRIEDETAGEIIQEVKRLAIEFHLPIYDEMTHHGLLRRVMVRTGHTSGQIMVVLVINPYYF